MRLVLDRVPLLDVLLPLPPELALRVLPPLVERLPPLDLLLPLLDLVVPLLDLLLPLLDLLLPLPRELTVRVLPPLVERLLLPPLRDRLAVERLTSLLKRLSSPPFVLSWYRNASLLSSKALNHSSQEIGCRLSSPLQPGKSMRIMPGSLRPPVPLTHAGVPPRSSTHLRMNS